MTDGEGWVVAWLRFHVERPNTRRARLYAAGTWVEGGWRGKGIAEAMWSRVMKRYRPRRVHVRTISPEGRALVARLVKWYPDVDFEVSA